MPTTPNFARWFPDPHAMDAGVRHRSALPPITRPDMGHETSSKREDAEIQAAEAILSIAPHHSTTRSTTYPGPPPPYSVAAPKTSHKSPSQPHRSLKDEHDTFREGASMRQSLPSLSEALGRSQSQAGYDRERSPPRPYLRRSASPRSSRYERDNDNSHSSHRQTALGYRDASPRHHPAPRPATYAPVNAPSSASPRSSYQWEMAPPPPPPVSQHPYHPPSATSSPTWEVPPPNRPASVHQSPSFAAQPYYAQQPDDHRSRAQPSPYITSYPTLATSSHTAPRDPPWPVDHDKYTDGRKHPRDYSSTVKQEFSKYDMESALNSVYEAGDSLMQFGNVYKLRVQDAARTGSLAGAEPTTEAVHEAIKFNQSIQQALSDILRRLETQEAEKAERFAQEVRNKHQASQMQTEDPPVSPGDERRDSATSGSDMKKRRGRAAPPGRCHSCHRAETPEWRRGPDGARTLCNACGLHYAKLTRKLGASRAAVIGSSNLRQRPLGDL